MDAIIRGKAKVGAPCCLQYKQENSSCTCSERSGFKVREARSRQGESLQHRTLDVEHFPVSSKQQTTAWPGLTPARTSSSFGDANENDPRASALHSATYNGASWTVSIWKSVGLTSGLQLQITPYWWKPEWTMKTEWEMELVIARPFPKVGTYAVTWSNDLVRSNTSISLEASSVHSMVSYSSSKVIRAECCRFRPESFSGHNRFSDEFSKFRNFP